MLIDLAKFMILFTVSFFIFACAGNTMFQSLTDYERLDTTFLTLFNAALGNFDYTVFADLEIGLRIAGYTFMTLYLLFMLITLLNFVIAILSDTYAILTEKSSALYY